MTRPYTCSASQVSTFELCARKWAWDKIAGLPRKPNRFAAFGTLTHTHLEAWLESGTVPPDTPEGNTARAMIPHLPATPQTPGVELEKHITPVLGGVQFNGYVDVLITRPGAPLVSDHKTTGGLQWAKTPATLLEDPQATLYAHDAMLAARTDACDLHWTYGTRHKRPQVHVVRALVTRQGIAPRIAKTTKSAQAMALIYDAAPDPLETPHDAAGCEAFGGCPFQDNCNLTTQEKIKSIMAQETTHSAFLLKLKAKRANGATPATAAPHPPAKAPATLPTTSGTINPPEAPATAATAPAPAPEPEAKPAKKPRKKRRTKAQMKAAAAAEEAEATAGHDTEAPVEPVADTPPTRAEPAPAPEPAPAMIGGAKLSGPSTAWQDGFERGFARGFEAGRKR